MNINAISLSLSDACCAKEPLSWCGMQHFGWSYRLYQAMEWALSHPDKGFIRQPSGAYQTAFLRKRLMHRALAYIFKTRVYARKKFFLTSDDTLVKLTLYIYTHPEAFCIFIHPIPALSSQCLNIGVPTATGHGGTIQKMPFFILYCRPFTLSLHNIYAAPSLDGVTY